jgi:hypothetical protein
MSNFDNKSVYSLLCSKLVLKYLDTNDKLEFSSSCEYIYQKCTKFRLSVYEFRSYELAEYTSIINTQVESTEQTYNHRLEHIGKIVNRYKPHLMYLNCRDNDGYYILEHFPTKFNCLKSLNMLDNRIPQKSFKNIIKNLPNLQILILRTVGIELEENNLASSEFEFPKYLKKLTVSNCYQFDCNSKDPVNMGVDRVIEANSNNFNLDMSNIVINTVKNLSWSSHFRGSISTLNRLLINNTDLETLKIDLDRLNSYSLSIISKNRNLIKLVISFYSGMRPDSRILPKLPFIKSIELVDISKRQIKYASQILQICPNLEELKYCLFTENRTILHPNIKNYRNLKKLSIFHSNIDLILSIPFPYSTIEHLEFTISTPFKIEFSIFNRLKHLKRISINWVSRESMSYSYGSQSFDSSCNWKEIKYFNSVQFWKIL